jgi:hypothetical protein
MMTLLHVGRLQPYSKMIDLSENIWQGQTRQLIFSDSELGRKKLYEH